MKQRIIATILLLVTVLTTFAGCANYAFAEDKNFAEYAKVDYDELMKALHTIEIEEEDFGPTEDRQAIVVDEIYNTILTALAKNADNKLKTGSISERDMVEYYYYCTYEANGKVYSYGYAMTTTTNTLTTSSSSDAEKELKAAIVDTLIESAYNFDEETAYSIKTSLSNEKITKDDTIVVSYTIKTTNGDVVNYTDYANVAISAGNELFDAIITNNENAVLIGSYKPGEETVVGENTYKNIVISHIVENAGTSVTVEQTTEDEQDVTAYVDGRKVTVTIPEGATVKYVVYPVAYVKAPVVTADTIVRYVLGDDISTSDLAVLGSEEYTVTVGEETLTVKALVEKLAAEYKNGGDHYENLDYVKDAKDALVAEREAAKAQAIKDAIDALAKATKVIDGDTKKVTEVILAEYNEGKADEDKAADIYAVFAALSTEGKIKFSSIINGGILTLYTFKNADGVSAVTLINNINDEYAKNVETEYESYKKDLDSKKAGNEIDVPDKKERYEDAVAQAQITAVNDIIKNLLACKNGETSVEDAIVGAYKTSSYYTEFTAYDLVKNILLTSSATSSTFSFIEDLSDYVYGTSNVDDEDRETFTSVLTELVAEFGKTATADYETVEAVKTAKLAVETANIAAESYSTISTYASELKNYKKGDENAFNALANVYIGSHPATVYVIKDAKTNQKIASSYASTVLQLILDDEDRVEDYKAALEGYTKTTGEITDNASNYFEKALSANAAYKAVTDAETVYADAQNAAYESAVNALIAKLLSGVITEEHDGETETNKLSVVLPKRYVDNTLNSKISTYNRNVQNKLSKAIYEIINDETIVTVDSKHEAYPANLINDFVKTIKAGYEYTYYTGTSTETTPGTPATGVTPEMRAEYEKLVAIYDEANAAITSAETGISNAITAYVTALVTIYDMEALLEVETPYFGEENDFNALVKAYFDANTAYNTANTENTNAKNALTKAQKALNEAEKYLETAKAEKVGLFDFEAQAAKRAAIKDAKTNVKNAEKAVKAADEALNGTKKTDGTKQKLEAATDALADAKDALIEAFSTNGNNETFVTSEESYSNKKSTYNSKSTTYSDKKSTYNTYHDSYKSALEKAQAAVTEAGENATQEQKDALTAAEKKYNDLVKDYNDAAKAYLEAATAYVEVALTYYADANAVKTVAEAAFKPVAAILDDQKDDDGNVTSEGLRTKIANAEKDTKGETLKNVDAYATFEDYLEYVLGYDYETALRDEAVAMLDEQIRVYAVANTLVEKGVIENGYVNEELGINVEGYKAAIESRKETFEKLLSHSITHDDEDMRPGKLKRELKKAWKDLIESTEEVLVTKKVYRAYKNELGRSNYIYAKNQYGDNNLRMYLQFENLLNYLLFTDYQENPYAAHHGEYAVKETEDGKLDFLFITYDFKAEDAE